MASTAGPLPLPLSPGLPRQSMAYDGSGQDMVSDDGIYNKVAEAGLGLAQLFHKQAEETPEAVAVVDGETTLSYHRLHEKASRLARLLNQGGDPAGLSQEPVGIVVQHGVADVVAQMAVLYAGGSCAPMDPTLVDHQIESRLARLKARFVVVDEPNLGRALPFEIICLGDQHAEETLTLSCPSSAPDLSKIRALAAAPPGRLPEPTPATTPTEDKSPLPAPGPVSEPTPATTPDFSPKLPTKTPASALIPPQALEPTPAATPALSDAPVPTYPVPSGLEHCTHLIHTSGTTGEPKAVSIAGRSILHVAYHVPLEPVRPDDVVAHVNNSSFDVSLLDVWAPLLRGARIAVLSKATLLDPPAMEREIERLGISVMATTTALLNLVAFTRPGAFSGLRICFIGGEQANVGAIKVIFDQKSAPEMLVNAYGPTECCVFCLAHIVRAEDVEAGSVSIGKPVGRTVAFVVDDEGKPSEEGELWIGGPGVSPGYANQPAKTEASFPTVQDGVRVYRTGDVVRRRADGQIDYVGRRDHQVKVRGFRIELGAVESALLQTGLFAEAVALKIDVPRLGAGSILVAYAVPVRVTESPTVEEALKAVRVLLPDYMVPQLEIVPRLPLSSHAKVDRKQLAELFARRWKPATMVAGTEEEAAAKHHLHRQQHAPVESVRATMAELWTSILAAAPAGDLKDGDDFISLGGSSLQASLLVSQIRQTFGLEVPLLTLYRDFSLGAVSSVVAKGLEGSVPAPPDERETWVADTLIGDELAAPSGPAIDWRRDDEGRVFFTGATGFLAAPSGPAIDWRRDDEGRVFFTGATGFVGAFMLADLMRTPHVAAVCCLVRAADADEGLQRLRVGMAKYGLWEESFASRLEVVTGLLEDEYRGTSSSIVGARVNYTQPYGLHRAANTLGTLNVVRFATAGERVKTLHYVSSISCFGPTGLLTGAKTVVEDEPLLSHLDALPLDHGYAQSQWVAEQLVARLMARGFPIAVYRPGFVTGHSRTGACNRDDFVSRLIEACCEMGCYPLLPNQRKEFVPVDYVSSAILHIASAPSSAGKAYHIVPPRRDASVDMDATMDLVGEAARRPLLGVPYAEWVQRLAVVAPLRLLPLQPMLAEKIYQGRTRWELYENMPVYDTSNTDAALADYPGGPLELPKLDVALMKRYIDFIDRTKVRDAALSSVA
ncbi:hypothetical protein L249_8917 [Ophiocordyceps polyrhachis-furcata BCC 54312]|uniref:Carrier domain-containing protein n=1 Tax=Ophiocordyceps polyrhachis-furcata BCC 54312 TaxID=1330021 RepID=A0A367L1W3_9HYPO|nr:hypothetical protein L249_8917 [Ophiocordyceps polyrhachis-furcata BCC 54312]